jgi:hypothetical protein
MSNLHKPLVVVVLVLVAILAAESVVLAAAVGRNGRAITAVRTVTDAEPWAAPGVTGFVDLPDMKTFISVPAGEKALLVITFSADSTCGAPDNAVAECEIKVTLDGNGVSPGTVNWSFAAPDVPGSGESGVRSMQWVAGPVPSGNHQVKVQGRLARPGSFSIGERTLTVLRAKFV